ncbi:MAG TPA: hypothetical protein VFH51_06495, partial [Myxococcota bacterium]|nr:hypothetical protein [Myxococcota bacterium]
MRSSGLGLVVLLLATRPVAAAPPPEIPDEVRLLYNARLTLHDRQPRQTLKHWLLYKAYLQLHPSRRDVYADMASTTWTALGDLGLCPDGMPFDDGGAGLWPVALHNWLVRAFHGGGEIDPEAPFDAFDVGLQQRFVSLQDVLSPAELRSATFRKTGCLLPSLIQWQQEPTRWPDWQDRRRLAELLRHLLRLTDTTLVRAKVRGYAAVQVRIFDINLYLAQLAAVEARPDTNRAADPGTVAATVRTSGAPTPAPDAEAAALLRASLSWPVSEWLLLAPERRLFLLPQARLLAPTSEPADALTLDLIDALTRRRDGAEVERWIASLEAAADPAKRTRVWAGPRGQALLGLDREAGFRERAAIALHRGVASLEQNELAEALRAFAFALQTAPESRAADRVTALARRWLAFVVGQHATTPELLTTLRSLLPGQEVDLLVQDLTWRAALRADAASFAALTRTRSRRTAFDDRVDRLAPLAAGRAADFERAIATGLRDERRLTLRFLDELVTRLEMEGATVRQTQAGTLAWLVNVLASEN